MLSTDGLKRVVQTKKDARVYQAPDTNTHGDVMTVSGRVFNTACDTSEPPTVTAYDVLDRVTQVTIPDDHHRL